MDTIFALATAQGKSGVAVVRFSGPKAFDAVSHLTAPVQPRRATLRKLSAGEEVLDEAVVLTFPGPGSFTGEDVAEFHLHGSRATVAAVLSIFREIEGFRIAEPGEFTRRALENERLDLTQVEGLADLIEAETEVQRKQALRVFSGAIGEKASEWRHDLIRAAALVEATIDFADEDVPTDVLPEVRTLLVRIAASLDEALRGTEVSERIRDGFEVAIVGRPNAGKSTLLNALAGREAAITSEIAGTTRDAIEVRMDLLGLPVTLIDTAGLREAGDAIEAIGIQKALERSQNADLRVILNGVGEEPVIVPSEDDLLVVPKSDLGRGDFSARTGDGLDRLVSRISDVLSRRASSAGVLIRERHSRSIVQARRSLESALDRIDTGEESAELVAEDIRSAIRALDVLVGQVGVEDVLGEIFSSFCIGK